jgi:dTDP-4-dehydrorhamnose 3,5-epimerase
MLLVPDLPQPDPGIRKSEMQVERFNIPGVLAIVPIKRFDHRGFFSEIYRREALVSEGVTEEFVQENQVYSDRQGVLRGLHFQIPPHAQGKLVRCVRGAVLDVGVDIRMESPFFGQHVAIELSAANGKQLWLPPGFAHGYVTLEAKCEVLYRVTDYWAPTCERGIAWDDPNLGINWIIPKPDVVLADKDRGHPLLTEIEPFFHYHPGTS